MLSKSTKPLVFILLLGLVGSILYLFPLEKRRVEAAGLPVWDIPAWVERTLDIVGQQIGKRVLDQTIQSTIKWANSGFEGNPAYIQNPGRFYGQIGSGVVGEYIANDTNFGFLCSPIQATIRLSLVKQFISEPQYQCTLEQIGVNLENFYNRFDEGGWDAWFQMTQTEGNNPYGGYLSVKADIDSRLANSLSIAQEERQINSGFLSWKECLTRNPNPPQELIDRYYNGETDAQIEMESNYYGYNPALAPGACSQYGDPQTPGSVIKTQLDNSLFAGASKLIQADQWNELLSAFMTGLLDRFVFNSDKGLFSNTSGAAIVREIVDVDGDGIPDGYDTDNNGELDICHHGKKDPAQEADNDNCILSKNTTNSPFFVPICEAASNATAGLQAYQNYIDRTVAGKPTYTAFWRGRSYTVASAWDPSGGAARTWQNRTLNAQSTVDDFVNTISRYEVAAYDAIIGNFGLYSSHLNAIVESLLTGGDMRNGGLPSDDNVTIHITSLGNRERLNYLSNFTAAIEQCSNPNEDAINNIPLPPDIDNPNATTTATSTP